MNKSSFHTNNGFGTITLGDCMENHRGMQIKGHLVEKGNGFTLDDLNIMREIMENYGCTCEVIHLNQALDVKVEVDVDNAYVLVVRNGLNTILNQLTNNDKGYIDLCREQSLLHLDTTAFMYGRVANKLARHNACFGEEEQQSDIAHGKGTIHDKQTAPLTNLLRTNIHQLFPDINNKLNELQGEGNYYYNPSKCGIGFHGDFERRKVIGFRFGENSYPLHFQWFQNSLPIGKRVIIPLQGGDMYVMSEKAVGTDWKLRKICTLRHATGCEKFVSIKEKKPKKAKKEKKLKKEKKPTFVANCV